MSRDQRPFLPQLLILFREDEDRIGVEPVEPRLELDPQPRCGLCLRRAPVRKAG